MAAPFNAVRVHDPKITGQAIMAWRETDQMTKIKREAKEMYAVSVFAPEQATGYAKKLFNNLTTGWGDETRALKEAARLAGMTPSAYKRLMKGNVKIVEIGVFGRVRAAYLDHCERLIKRLQHEVDADIMRYGNDAFEDLGAEISALAEKIKAAKEGR